MREASLAYCSMRLLADDLAAAGYPALRFDYPAAGNSVDADLNESGHHWTAWQSSIEARDRMAARPGCAAHRAVRPRRRRHARAALVAAAARRDIAGLLLFEPAIVGRSYIRQMILEADLQSGQSMPRELGLEIRENKFGPKSVEQIGAFDLRKLELRAGMKVGDLRADRKQGGRRLREGMDGARCRGEPARLRRPDGAAALRHARRAGPRRLHAADRLARARGAAGDALGHAGQPAGGRCCSRRAASTRR